MQMSRNAVSENGKHAPMAKKTAFDRITRDLKNAFNGHGLIFTPFIEADPVKFGEYMHADEDAWITHVGGKPLAGGDPTDELAYMNGYTRSRGTQFDFLLQREPNGPYVGYTNIMLHPHNRTAMVGYYMLPSTRNHGVATQTVEIITRQLGSIAHRIGLKELGASVRDDNAPSVRVLEKAGFENRGVRPSQFGRPGTFLGFVQSLKLNQDKTRER